MLCFRRLTWWDSRRRWIGSACRYQMLAWRWWDRARTLTIQSHNDNAHSCHHDVSRRLHCTIRGARECEMSRFSSSCYQPSAILLRLLFVSTGQHGTVEQLCCILATRNSHALILWIIEYQQCYGSVTLRDVDELVMSDCRSAEHSLIKRLLSDELRWGHTSSAAR